jgi:hypothetical protein
LFHLFALWLVMLYLVILKVRCSPKAHSHDYINNKGRLPGCQGRDIHSDYIHLIQGTLCPHDD